MDLSITIWAMWANYFSQKNEKMYLIYLFTRNYEIWVENRFLSFFSQKMGRFWMFLLR